jgi:hypothetical protein
MKLTLLHHAGNPNMCRIPELTICTMPECEGGGWYLPRREAEFLVLSATRPSPSPAAIEAWQPISTAPSACHVIAARFDECEWIYGLVSSPPTKPFTHWQPLPAPPIHRDDHEGSQS